MPLGRLLRAASGARGFRRSLFTAAESRQGGCWTWYLLSKMTMAAGQETGPAVAFVSPPSLSHLSVPEHLGKHSGGLPLPGPDDDVVRVLVAEACSSSQDGFLLVNVKDIRVAASLLAGQGGTQVRHFTGFANPRNHPGMTHYVLNPYTREMSSCLPEIEGPKKTLAGFSLGLLTQADAGGLGPPDRYAVAEMAPHMGLMLRFLSDTGEWQILQGSPCHLPAGRPFMPDQEAVAWKGRLWWVDLTVGAICADPFSDRPEPCFVPLPSGSVLSEDIRGKAMDEVIQRGFNLEAEACWSTEPRMYRRVGVSGGWLRYVELSEKEPFILCSFELNADGSGWRLKHRLELSRLWADGGHPSLPLQQGDMTPQIGGLDRANANLVYVNVKKHIVCVDMQKGKVAGHCPHGDGDSFLTCLMTPWLPYSPIPGKKDVRRKSM